MASDAGGTSDPFIISYFNGRRLGVTRVKPRTLNPKWDSETVIVPTDSNLPPSRGMKNSQKDLFRMELYDYDWWTMNDFLGHVEIQRENLIKMVEEAGDHPIRLPFTLREFHGFLYVYFGILNDKFRIKIYRGESLEIVDPFGLSDPFCMIYVGDKLLGKTPVCPNTLDPEWTTEETKGYFTDRDKLNTFDINLSDVQVRQTDLINKLRELGRYPSELTK